jgi:hypothetical protein
MAEYRELDKLAERLGLKRDDEERDAGATVQPKPSAPGKRSATPAAKRAAKRPPAKRAAVRKPNAAAKAKGRPKVAARRSSAEHKTGARTRTAAAPGQREQDVLRLVRERPGVTVAELAAELHVDATGLYGVVRRLQAKGQIRKDGTQLRLADASASAGDGALDTTSEPPAGPLDTSTPTGHGSDPAAPQPAGASTTADEPS